MRQSFGNRAGNTHKPIQYQAPLSTPYLSMTIFRLPKCRLTRGSLKGLDDDPKATDEEISQMRVKMERLLAGPPERLISTPRTRASFSLCAELPL